MENNLVIKTEKVFEEIKHVDENGVEFWYARELMEILEYTKWGNFEKVINKAMKACKNSNINTLNHFADVGKTIKMPKGAEKIIYKTKYKNVKQNRKKSKKSFTFFRFCGTLIRRVDK